MVESKAVQREDDEKSELSLYIKKAFPFADADG